MLADCVTMQLPKVQDPRGNLTFIEGGRQIPFQIERVYYLYDVPGGSERGGHAHKNLHQFMIAMSGSFDIVLDDGFDRRRYHLNRSYEGLYIPPMTWRELDNFSSGSVCMVLASRFYDEADYLRNYSDFMLEVHSRKRAAELEAQERAAARGARETVPERVHETAANSVRETEIINIS